MTIGRAPWSSIELPGSTVSRDHARIVYRQGGYWLEDLRSQNGTLLNNEAVVAPRLLVARDRIEMGVYRAIFHADETNAAVRLSETAVAVAMYEMDGRGGPPTAINSQGGTSGAAMEHLLFAKLDLVGQTLISSSPHSTIYQVIVDLVSEVLAADRVHLLLPDQGGEGFISKASRGSGSNGGSILISRSIARQAFDDRRAMLISDAQHDERFRHQPSVVSQQIQSAVCAPLWRDSAVLGLLYADKTAHSGVFSVVDLHVITVIGHLAAVKILETEAQEELRQRQQLEDELRNAAAVQRMLLPGDPLETEHLLIAGRFLPCHGVSGDYYDVLCHDDESVTLVIADVAGKGMAAALLMAGLHARIHAHLEASLPLPELVAKLNNYIIDCVRGTKTVTLFCAHLDPSSGSFSYVNAGHNAPILLGADGRARELSSGGMLLGSFPEATFTSRELELKPGDLLVMYSDGVVEAETVAEVEFGQERLLAVLKENAGAPPAEIVESIVGSVCRFSEPQPPRDDVTVLVVRLI
jgi:sigma-B regulation protein RsbU (phosphoserine phosphatase)